MTIIRNINGGGDWNSIRIVGNNRNKDIGLRIHVPINEIVFINNIYIENVFIPLIKTGPGKLIWNTLFAKEFGGDCCNLRSSNIDGRQLVVRNNTPTRPYQTCIRNGEESVSACLERHGEVVHDPALLEFQLITSPNNKYVGREVLTGYHCDGVAQLYLVKEDGYTLDSDGILSDIRIQSIDAEVTGKFTQGVMGSGRNRYTRIDLGEDMYRIALDGYTYHSVFNQLDNSYIGGNNNCVTDGSKIKVHAAKATRYVSCNNQYVGFDESSILEY